MTSPRMDVASLDSQSLAKIKAFEEEIGFYVVALEPRYTLAQLSDDQLSQLKVLEQELGVVLLSYQKDE